MCGHLIEVISGKPLEEFLRERLFEPWTPDTGFSVLTTNWIGSRPVMNALLINHSACKTTRKRVALGNLQAPSGAGGLVGTTGDYAHFCEMLVNRGQFRGRQLIVRPFLI